MPLKYISLFTDMLDDDFEDLTDEEVGQIIRAALRYAADGTEPEFGRRTVVGMAWKRMKRHVDQCAAKSETQSSNGSKGGRPKTQQNPTKANESQRKPVITGFRPFERALKIRWWRHRTGSSPVSSTIRKC